MTLPRPFDFEVHLEQTEMVGLVTKGSKKLEALAAGVKAAISLNSCVECNLLCNMQCCVAS